MRPTLRVRMPWREVSSRLARYRASHVRMAQEDNAPMADSCRDSDERGATRNTSTNDTNKAECEVWSPELVSVLRRVRGSNGSKIVEKWIPQLPRPDGELTIRSPAADSSSPLTCAYPFGS